MNQATELTISMCPHCGGEPAPLNVPGADVIACTKCGASGPPEAGAEGPERLRRAVLSYNRRGGIGNVRIAAVKEGTTAETCIVAEGLTGVAAKCYENQFGPVDVSLLLLLDSKTKRLGIVPHRLDDAGMEWICREVVKLLEQKRAVNRAKHGGLILPGR